MLLFGGKLRNLDMQKKFELISMRKKRGVIDLLELRRKGIIIKIES